MYSYILNNIIIYFLEESTSTDSKTLNSDEIKSNSIAKQSKQIDDNKEVNSRTRLLMSLNQMMIHNYPLPTNKRQFTMDGFRFTKSHYLPVTDESPMYAIDCEMCYTSIGRNELTRVSIINEQLDVSFKKCICIYSGKNEHGEVMFFSFVDCLILSLIYERCEKINEI